MAAEAEEQTFVDWRLEIVRRNLVGRKVQVELTTTIAETLFFQDDDIPLAHPTQALDAVLKGYWRILAGAATIFTRDEWILLSRWESPFHHEGFEFDSAAALADDYAGQYTGDDWCAEVLAIKRLLPKIRSLSSSEFESVREIFFYLRNLRSDDSMFTLSQKLAALSE
jgi:hypothetical protein